MRPIWWVVIGAVGAIILIKLLAKAMPVSNTTVKLKALANTPQASNLIKTNEFRELVKTKEFLSFALTLAEDQVGTMSQAISGNQLRSTV